MVENVDHRQTGKKSEQEGPVNYEGPASGHTDPALQEQLKALPRRPGVYIFRDKADTVIYVGKAQDLRLRVRSYFQHAVNPSPRLQSLRRTIYSLSTIVTDSEEEAFILESNLIKEHAPRFNVQFKDDKHYPYLCFTMDEDFPRLEVARRVMLKDYRYFGPYSNAGAMRETIRLIKKIFPLRSCRQPLREGEMRSRPCLNYQIKRCLAPCRGELSAQEYAALVQQVCLFLEGRQRALLRKIEADMKTAAAGLHFEKAARLRDQHAALLKMMERQKVLSSDGRDRDVIVLENLNREWVAALFRVRGGKLLAAEYFIPAAAAETEGAEMMKEFLRHYYGRASFIPAELLLSPLPAELELLEVWLQKLNNKKKVTIYHPRRGEKKALLELLRQNALLHLQQLQERRNSEEDALSALAGALNLAALPQRIEGYDISHFAGHETVGAMVVFEGGKPSKDSYRRFNICAANPADDYAALAEVLRRRLQHEKLPLPDLLLVDGGRGQLSAALSVLSETSRPAPALVALAKEHEQIFLPGRSLPLTLPRSHPALKLLQKVRDEAHRFASAHSREKQVRRSLSSKLRDVPGIGPARSKAVMQHFGGMENLRKATLAELAAVPGMNKTAAEALYAYLQGLTEDS